MLLNQIVANKRREIQLLKRRMPAENLQQMIAEKPKKIRSFREQLKSKGKSIRLICEMKKASPSEGLMKRVYLPRKIASLYERSGASAISILTDKTYFQGSIHTINHVNAVTQLPILRKDFLIDEYQVYESAAYGADAILLIVAILTDQELLRMILLAKKLGLDVLVEAHNDTEVKRAIHAEADIIGINNRNLDTLKIDLIHAEKLIRQIPDRITRVVESGIHSRKDIERYQTIGVHAFLIGTAFMKAGDIAGKVKEFLGHHAQ